MLSKSEIISFFENDFRECFERQAHTIPAAERKIVSSQLKRNSVFKILWLADQRGQDYFRDEARARINLIRDIRRCICNGDDPDIFTRQGHMSALRGILHRDNYYFTEAYHVLVQLLPGDMSVDERVDLFIAHMELYRGAGLEGIEP